MMRCRDFLITGDITVQAFDLIVIGSGTVGSVLASTCRSAGWTVAVVDSLPFGTERNVPEPGFEWFNHSIAPNPEVDKTYRVQIGNTQCTHPYQSSILNISAMSFGALSAAADLECGSNNFCRWR